MQTSSKVQAGYQHPGYQLLQEMDLFGNLLLLMHIFVLCLNQVTLESS